LTDVVLSHDWSAVIDKRLSHRNQYDGRNWLGSAEEWTSDPDRLITQTDQLRVGSVEGEDGTERVESEIGNERHYKEAELSRLEKEVDHQVSVDCDISPGTAVNCSDQSQIRQGVEVKSKEDQLEEISCAGSVMEMKLGGSTGASSDELCIKSSPTLNSDAVQIRNKDVVTKPSQDTHPDVISVVRSKGEPAFPPTTELCKDDDFKQDVSASSDSMNPISCIPPMNSLSAIHELKTELLLKRSKSVFTRDSTAIKSPLDMLFEVDKRKMDVTNDNGQVKVTDKENEIPRSTNMSPMNLTKSRSIAAKDYFVKSSSENQVQACSDSVITDAEKTNCGLKSGAEGSSVQNQKNILPSAGDTSASDSSSADGCSSTKRLEGQSGNWKSLTTIDKEKEPPGITYPCQRAFPLFSECSTSIPPGSIPPGSYSLARRPLSEIYSQSGGSGLWKSCGDSSVDESSAMRRSESTSGSKSLIDISGQIKLARSCSRVNNNISEPSVKSGLIGERSDSIPRLSDKDPKNLLLIRRPILRLKGDRAVLSASGYANWGSPCTTPTPSETSSPCSTPTITNTPSLSGSARDMNVYQQSCFQRNDGFRCSSASFSSIVSASSSYSTIEDMQAHEIRKLRQELEVAKEKISSLTTQLSVNVLFEQSLDRMTQKCKQLSGMLDQKVRTLTLTLSSMNITIILFQKLSIVKL